MRGDETNHRHGLMRLAYLLPKVRRIGIGVRFSRSFVVLHVDGFEHHSVQWFGSPVGRRSQER